VAPEKTEDIASKIKELEERIVRSFERLSGQDVKVDD
jgi:type I restriction enzyme M protein